MYDHLKELNRDVEHRDPNVIWFDGGNGYVIPFEGSYLCVEPWGAILRDADILLHTHIINCSESNDNGQLVSRVTPSWQALREEILLDPTFLNLFPQWDRKFEEFVAGGYVESKWN